jgi:predicted transcriptional regulator
VKQKLELIKDYKADVEIHLDVDFIRMPDKHAKMYFKEPDKVRFTSDEFIMLPKRGVGISTRKILKGGYLAVFSGTEEINGKDNVMIKVIPEGNKSDIVLSTLWINPENALVNRMENTTRNNGSYLIHLTYADPDIELPTEIKISFRVKELKIPLKFLGKNSSVDKKELKKEGPKEGIITVKLKYFDINKGIEDSFFEEDEELGE